MKNWKDEAKIQQLAKDFNISPKVVELLWDLGYSRGYEDAYKEASVDNASMSTLDENGTQQTL